MRVAGCSPARYELQHVLGSGGTATVWLAYDGRLDRTVAVKVLQTDLSDEHAHRIEREARAAACIADSRVVTVLDLDHDVDGTPFLRRLRQAGLGCRARPTDWPPAAVGLVTGAAMSVIADER